MPVFGLVVAGPYDGAVLGTLLRRLRPSGTVLRIRICGNDARVRSTFQNKLAEFERDNRGPVNKAIVVCDSHASREHAVRQKLSSSFSPANYRFPVKFVVIVPELEAWLLADHNAATAIRPESEGAGRPPTPSPPEQLSDPKQELQLRLKGIGYTKEVASRLAELCDLTVIEGCCPSFTPFKRAAQDC